MVAVCQSLHIVDLILYNFMFEIEPRAFWIRLALYHQVITLLLQPECFKQVELNDVSYSLIVV